MNKFSYLVFFISLNLFARPIIIGSKNFSESIIISELMAITLEEKFNAKVIRKHALGGTKVAFDALRQGGIDIYPDYTGTGYVMILKMSGENNPQKVHSIVSREFSKKYNLSWSKSLGFNNTYALTVRSKDPRFAHLNKISDLSKKSKDFWYAAPHEFMERKDGHEQFTKKYALNFSPDKIISMEAGLTYAAIKNEEADLIISYSTDGRIGAYELKILEDDFGFFPPYQAAYLTKTSLLNEFPFIRQAITLLEGQINEKEMTKMNDLVDRLKQPPKEVARNFLISKGIIKGDRTALREDLGLIQYFIAQRAYLFKLLKEHFYLSFGALFLALLVSIPTGIILTRFESLGKFVFPIINTIQTIPSLALLGFLIPVMGIGFTPALLALFLYSLLPLVRNTYSGIREIDRSYIEAARGIGLTNSQILFRVEIPLALPVIIAGFRTAAVIVIGTATLAALIGAGGLGDPIFRGVSTVNSKLILLGAIPTAILAICLDKIIGRLEYTFVSKGIRLKRS